MSSSFSEITNNIRSTQTKKIAYNNVQKRVATLGGRLKLAEFGTNGVIEIPTFSNFNISAEVLCDNSFIYVVYPEIVGTITATLPTAAELIPCLTKAHGFRLPKGFSKYIVFTPGGSPPNVTGSKIKIVPPDLSMIIGSSITTSNNLLYAGTAVSVLIYIVDSSVENPQYKVLFTRNN